MEKNPKKTFSKLKVNSLLLIVGVVSPLLVYVGLTSGMVWLSSMAAGLIVGDMVLVILYS